MGGNADVAVRPRVTLKVATSLDGKIATATGHSQWITGPAARAQVHLLRAAHDAILTGIGTVLADDPALTARTDPSPKVQPTRVVLDTNGRLPASAKLLATQDQAALRVFQAHGTAANYPEITEFVARNASGGGLVLGDVLQALYAAGLRTVMVEAGARLGGAFLRAGLVDRIEWFRAPFLIGGDGLSVVDTLGVGTLSQANLLKRLDIVPCGPDVWERYEVLVQASPNP
jgi:diaminohydroxyphosphoribosylaminopyrimidine deaminase / 5-amino-6-(5-phosphoribosylamino)uracil reductase